MRKAKRRRLPRKTDLATLRPDQLQACVQRYNDTPRKCLHFLTPYEALLMLIPLLHFKREYTFPLARGVGRRFYYDA